MRFKSEGRIDRKMEATDQGQIKGEKKLKDEYKYERQYRCLVVVSHLHYSELPLQGGVPRSSLTTRQNRIAHMVLCTRPKMADNSLITIVHLLGYLPSYSREQDVLTWMS